jgi:uncharacterized protein YdcH (DUF465 family)
MTRTLPRFNPTSLSELRRIWREYPTQDIRNLALEVEHYRRLVADLDKLYLTIHQAWREEVGGNLIALHRMQCALTQERERLKL